MENNESNHRLNEKSPLIPREFKSRFQKWTYPLILSLAITVGIITVATATYFWSPGSRPVVPSTTNWNQKGITFTNGKYCPWVRFGTANAQLSLQNLASTGSNFVAVVVTYFQDNINTTNLYDTSFTATDSELISTIQQAHSLGLKVMLKPHVDLYADPDHWRGQIGTYFTESQWNDWFNSYSQFLLHYAVLAQEYSVEQISLGSKRESDWRLLATEVRGVFQGNLTYSANWGGEETNKTWWDAVDFIGVDAYYPLCPHIENATVSELMDCWQVVIEEGLHDGIDGAYMTGGLRNLSTVWNKTIIFTEIGYCSGACTMGPKVDLMSQMFHYEAVFETFRNVSWFDGVFWWNWVSDPAFGGSENYCCTPQFKPTENLLRSEYGGSSPSTIPEEGAVCPCIL